MTARAFTYEDEAALFAAGVGGDPVAFLKLADIASILSGIDRTQREALSQIEVFARCAMFCGGLSEMRYLADILIARAVDLAGEDDERANNFLSEAFDLLDHTIEHGETADIAAAASMLSLAADWGIEQAALRLQRLTEELPKETAANVAATSAEFLKDARAHVDALEAIKVQALAERSQSLASSTAGEGA